jgi:hypothetical protein
MAQRGRSFSACRGCRSAKVRAHPHARPSCVPCALGVRSPSSARHRSTRIPPRATPRPRLLGSMTPCGRPVLAARQVKCSRDRPCPRCIDIAMDCVSVVTPAPPSPAESPLLFHNNRIGTNPRKADAAGGLKNRRRPAAGAIGSRHAARRAARASKACTRARRWAARPGGSGRAGRSPGRRGGERWCRRPPAARGIGPRCTAGFRDSAFRVRCRHASAAAARQRRRPQPAQPHLRPRPL